MLTPAPPGTRFRFTVAFENLREEDLTLLLYCLALEEQATVRLGPAALGYPTHGGGLVLSGPLRHKIGGAKPHGAGSVRIRVNRLSWTSPSERYRTGKGIEVLDGEALVEEVSRWTSDFVSRNDETMQELRSMLIYSAEDPRKPIRYPSYRWFKNNPQTRLKPTK